jgi:CAAX protease family protein
MSVVRRHPVITFFLLAYALSWAAIPWQSFFAPGVLVAALIVVSLTEGVAGLRAMGSRLIRWRVSWIWYALALAVPLAVTFAAIGLNTAFGAPVPDITEFSVWYGLPMAIAINIVNPLNAQLPEEASFRGWVQPKLQTIRTPLAATALMAIGSPSGISRCSLCHSSDPAQSKPSPPSPSPSGTPGCSTTPRAARCSP